MHNSIKQFPAFSLTRLLKTVFAPKPGERVALLIDLPDPMMAKDYFFLRDAGLTIQRLAYEVFYQGLKNGGLAELGLQGGDLFAYQITGGSNLDLPNRGLDACGRKLSFERDIYPRYNILLCISTCSATAPLTAFAKRFGFRGATLHGLNEIILRTGLAVDYEEVSRNAEKLRLGLCRGEKPDVANLPAGEVYFVPEGAEGSFPLRYEDGTIGLMTVAGGRIRNAALLRGQPSVVAAHQAKLARDPVTGELGELGFGTQELPPAGRDIQDEKILGTFHVATGRSDHLGGKLTPDRFADRQNATHDDILFSPTKTPEIRVPQVRMQRDGGTVVVLEHFQPSVYLRQLLVS